MSNARFAAFLAVVLVIGVAQGAWSSDGDPVILGQNNLETRLTQISPRKATDDALSVGGRSYFDAVGALRINTSGIHMNCQGVIVVAAGSSTGSDPDAPCNLYGPILGTLNGPVPHGILLENIQTRLHRVRGTSTIVVHLNRVTSGPVAVAYAEFAGTPWGPDSSP